MISVVVPAAGSSTRIGGAINKQFMNLGQIPVIVHTLTVFQAIDEIAEILVVCRDWELALCQSLVDRYKLHKVRDIIIGGSTRQESVHNGIRRVAGKSDVIVVHDGARPLVTRDVICKCIETARLHGAACTAVQVKDTIKASSLDGYISNTLERSVLWSAQTPQAFEANLLRHAYEEASKSGFVGTDDSSLVERVGHRVKLVRGSYENIKITTPEDFIIGESILRSRLADAKHN